MELFVRLLLNKVHFLGIIPEVPSSLDPYNRSEILRYLDNARRQGRLPYPPSAFHSSQTRSVVDNSAIFSINVHDIKLNRYAVNSTGATECLPYITY